MGEIITLGIRGGEDEVGVLEAKDVIVDDVVGLDSRSGIVEDELKEDDFLLLENIEENRSFFP